MAEIPDRHLYLPKKQKHRQYFAEWCFYPFGNCFLSVETADIVHIYIIELFRSKEGVKFSVSMGKIFFDKNKICIIVLSKFLVFCCRIIYLIIVIAHSTQVILEF